MHVDFYKEINLVYVKSIHFTSIFPVRKCFIGVSVGVFWVNYLSANVKPKKNFPV